MSYVSSVFVVRLGHAINLSETPQLHRYLEFCGRRKIINNNRVAFWQQVSPTGNISFLATHEVVKAAAVAIVSKVISPNQWQ